MTRGALYAQAVRGPLVLITLGVLFAMQQAGLVSLARTWPLIIIVVGVVKLLERLLTQPVYTAGAYQQYPQQPPPGNTGAPRV